MRSQAVVRTDRRRHFRRISRPDTGIDRLPPVAVRPAIEAALAHGREVVGYEVGTDFIPLVYDRPELSCPRLNRKGGGIAQSRGVGPVRAGRHIHFPNHGPVDLRLHPPFGDVAVGADSHIQETTVRARRQGFGPVVIDRRRKVRDLHRRPAGARVALDVIKAHQRVLVGDVQSVGNQCESVRCVQVLGEYGLNLVAAVAVCVSQQRQPVAALNRARPHGFDVTRHHVLGSQFRRPTSPTFSDQDVAIGKDEGLPRDREVRGDGRDRITRRHRRPLIPPLRRIGDPHRRH